jgi:hypothetical protein
MTGIMPYPKRQKTASGGGFKGKTPLSEQNKTLFSSEAFVYKAKTSFCSVSFCSLGLSHFARSPTFYFIHIGNRLVECATVVQ